ncbi:restriction endonuclease [Lactobacillus salivarius]|uniref:Restriction endonuclease n=1 Tax=Ligilactobacillus salivarius TaxID=1624 RepID=A0A6N9IP26_9LACO|nr:DEAD/DEAH box helicase family protein [Ligilactobacillus salivarius]MYY63857.1 restriction endonuclease [Ligilactobacillus salivarius]
MAIKIKANRRIIPMIYAYTTPEIVRHNGWIKIGYTDKQTVEERVKQQTHTADVKAKIEWKGNARYQDGSDELFTDHEFHEYLVNKRHIEREPNTEWFKIDKELSRHYYHQFTERDYSDLQGKSSGSQYELREEQDRAAEQAMNYFIKNGRGSEFLWNAKPRFGKTLTTYDLVRRMKLRNILIVTNRPSIANSWYDDFMKFISWQTNYYFISENAALKGKDVYSRKEYKKVIEDKDDDFGQITFESLQGLKRHLINGSIDKKLNWIADTSWDLLVIDEAHEGVDTYKTDRAFENIKRNYTLHLSGTPFKALASGKFSEKQIYNWSYADEQTAKEQWEKQGKDTSNPYGTMPKLNMFTYQMSEIMEEKAKQGFLLDDGDRVDPAFDLNEFFKTDNKGKFIYDSQVDRFLDALTTQEKYPFSTSELRKELAHTFWLLNRVDSAKALTKKLAEHEVFKNYKVVLAAGDGSLDEDEKESKKAFDRVQEAIQKYPRTITISVGQLTTGVTVKPWSAVMMLSSMKSPAEYMQAAFRAQNPYVYGDDEGHTLQKENAYVFDFDPTRTLMIFDKFANNLSPNTANGKGTAKEHEENIKRLLNFFPVIGEDENGKMVELDPKQVLSIPRRLKSQEVVKRGFMSNFLFANISNIFNSPSEIRDILGKLVLAKEEKGKKKDNTIDNAENVLVNSNGEIDIPEEKVIGEAKDLFGGKIFKEIDERIGYAEKDINEENIREQVKDLKQRINNVTDSLVDKVKEKHSLTNKQAKKYSDNLKKEHDQKLNQVMEDYDRKKKILENKIAKKQNQAKTKDDLAKLDKELEVGQNNIINELAKDLTKLTTDVKENTPKKIVERVNYDEEVKKKNEVEQDVRSHLRGFSRTIPSFIMAYGDKNLNLRNFDDYTEDDVFEEVTGITEEQFRFLRDGGDYTDQESGQKVHFEGHLFDEVVFNDSIQAFLKKREELSNYFDDESTEDIFDYIPAQKTNQIYTPKAVVKHMVDDLEKNNPGIFDDPNKTFADLYMKSGLYITEIVKRLFRSQKMKELYPDDNERIRHIMEYQVYGFAPTRIIYLIATNYIFGFSDEIKNNALDKHFKQIDTAQYAKEGTLEELIQDEFGQEKY